MSLTRRQFAKANAAAIAAAAAGLPIVTSASNLVTEADMTALDWNKAPCRFCGTGCGVLIGTKDGRVVAIGDVPGQAAQTLDASGQGLARGMQAISTFVRGELHRVQP